MQHIFHWYWNPDPVHCDCAPWVRRPREDGWRPSERTSCCHGSQTWFVFCLLGWISSLWFSCRLSLEKRIHEEDLACHFYCIALPVHVHVFHILGAFLHSQKSLGIKYLDTFSLDLKVKTSLETPPPPSKNEMEALITSHVNKYVLTNTWWYKFCRETAY